MRAREDGFKRKSSVRHKAEFTKERTIVIGTLDVKIEGEKHGRRNKPRLLDEQGRNWGKTRS